MTTDEAICSALAVLSGYGKVFTTSDIASFAELEGKEERIRIILSESESVIPLSLDNGEISASQAYLAKRSVGKWWFESMPRWACRGLDCVNAEQLARTISFTFDDKPWRGVDEALLRHGRTLAMVADGCVAETYVFPWALFLRSHPHLISLYREYSNHSLMELFHYGSIEREIAFLLHSLDGRDSIVIQKRFGLGGHRRSTLEEVGNEISVTRERVRQIEKRAIAHLRRSHFVRRAFRGFAANFMQSNGSTASPWPVFCITSGNS